MSKIRQAFFDLVRAVELYEIWGYLAIDDIVSRYKRTVLGPLWNAAYLAATAIALTIVFGGVFGQPLAVILPYILSGLIAWQLGPGAIIDSSTLLTSVSGTITTQNFPFFFYIFRSTARSVFMFMHNFIVLVVVFLCLARIPVPHWTILPALVVEVLAAVPFSMLIAMACARFRDVQMLVQNFSQILFFITPVFWLTSNVTGPRKAIVEYNPLYYAVDLVRQPLLGQAPHAVSWSVMCALLVGGWLACFALFSVNRARIPHWV